MIALTDAPSPVRIRFEPVNGDYQNSNVDLTSLRLVSTGMGDVGEISPLASKTVIEGDTDGDGIAELSACFARSDLARLFSSIRGRRTVNAALEGRLTNGRKFRAPLSLTVVGTGKPDKVTASVAPNPMNPRATLTFTMRDAGTVRAILYDVSGRRVKSIIEGAFYPSGTHSALIDGTDSRGTPLASGVYFYRIEMPGGATTGRFTIMK